MRASPSWQYAWCELIVFIRPLRVNTMLYGDTSQFNVVNIVNMPYDIDDLDYFYEDTVVFGDQNDCVVMYG